MAKHVIRIPETDAANDFASLLDRVRNGAEVITSAGLTTATGRLLSESIALWRPPSL